MTKKERSKDLIEYLRQLSDDAVERIDFSDLNAPINCEDENALHRALWTEELVIAKELIELGIDLNVPGDMGYTALHVAATKGQLEIVRLLVENGSDVFSMNEFNNTAIMTATREHGEVVEYLKSVMPRSEKLTAFIECLQSKMKEDLSDANVLRAAMIYGEINLARELILLGTDRHQSDKDGRKLLHHAASMGNLEMVKLLVTFTCITNALDHSHFTPMALASIMGHQEVEDYLRKVWREIETGEVRRLKLSVGIDIKDC